MAIQIQGNGGVVAEVDGSTYRALRSTIRPVDYGALGSYRVAQTVGLVVTQAANGTLFSFRWADATRFCVIHYLRLQEIQTSATATAALNDLRYQVFIARGFTASDSAGTAITLTGNSMKKRTSMGTSLVTDIRFSTVAAGLTAGTRTLDSNPILELQTNVLAVFPTAGFSQPFSKELDLTNGQDSPIVLAQNEGLIVRGPTTVFGAAGTGNLLVDMSWSEVTSF